MASCLLIKAKQGKARRGEEHFVIRRKIQLCKSNLQWSVESTQSAESANKGQDKYHARFSQAASYIIDIYLAHNYVQ